MMCGSAVVEQKHILRGYKINMHGQRISLPYKQIKHAVKAKWNPPEE